MKKVLVANRGEIALRVFRTLRERGIPSVAIYSEADRAALHVRSADEAYCAGPAPAKESYLCIDKILEIAKKAGVDAIHPGYGFLAENAAFANAVEKAGITFLGPQGKIMAQMGDKIEARKWAEKAKLPLVAASPPLQSLKEARAEAKKIGYPVLLKARAGGGGKGMRQVGKEEELASAFRMAQSEAKKAFSDDRLFLEQCLVQPRHIEVQIFGDGKGNMAALGNRECSIQRRHQKIIEEAPAPHLSEMTRKKMAEAACQLGRQLKYRGAGTAEFLVDQKERFYFLEVNARLQVEHPVTEWVTGLDLVALQLDVANGKSLPSEKEVRLVGHAIEVRIYAEDPDNHFFPSPGTLTQVQWPSGPGIRIDSGVETGSEIPLYYDPMIAKVSVWGKDRMQALVRLRRALAETRITGVKSNLTFLQLICAHPKFAAGKLSTTFVRDEGPFEPFAHSELTFEAALAAAALTSLAKLEPQSRRPTESAWWRSGLPSHRDEVLT